MIINSEEDIAKLIYTDQWMMDVLCAAEKLNLPDWWIGAGFLRNKVWDAIADRQSQQSRDIDLVYFNAADTSRESDDAYDIKMKQDYPFAEWEIRNQARMHYVDGFQPFVSTADGISHWVETATCVAVKSAGGTLRFLFCYGTDDLLGLIARPTSFFATGELLNRFYMRMADKRWQERWPELRVMPAQL